MVYNFANDVLRPDKDPRVSRVVPSGNGVEAIAEYLQGHCGLRFSLGLVEMRLFTGLSLKARAGSAGVARFSGTSRTSGNSKGRQAAQCTSAQRTVWAA